MAIVPVTDHAARAVAALVEQYKTKPKMMGLLTAMVNQVQDIEDALDGTAPVGTNLVGQSESVSTSQHLTITQNALVVLRTGQQLLGGTANLDLMINGVAQSVSGGIIPANTAAGTIVTLGASPWPFNANDLIEIRITNNAGVTQSIGVSPVAILMTIAA